MSLLRVWSRSLLPRLLALALLAGCAPAQAAAQDEGATVTKRGAIADDLYLAGQHVEVLADVDGDVLAAGRAPTRRAGNRASATALCAIHAARLTVRRGVVWLGVVRSGVLSRSTSSPAKVA